VVSARLRDTEELGVSWGWLHIGFLVCDEEMNCYDLSVALITPQKEVSV
jgi:hypothetical protein